MEHLDAYLEREVRVGVRSNGRGRGGAKQ
jgi:hypothetical protein